MKKEAITDVMKRVNKSVNDSRRKKWKNEWGMWNTSWSNTIIFYMNYGRNFQSSQKDVEQISEDIICVFDKSRNHKVFISVEDIVAVSARYAHPDVAREQ